MTEHSFGGDWTERKLDALGKYLKAYRQIFSKNPKAQHFKTIYVDAFAGTGSRKPPQKKDACTQELFDDDDLTIELGDTYRRGSARIALELDSPFDEYIFVDRNPKHAQELRNMISKDFPSLENRCKVWEDDGCEILRELCSYRNWKKERAVVFLDPYGMNVEWHLIKWIADTKAIDLWILFPLGMGANRLLTRDGRPNQAFADKLTRVFGTTEWQRFYRKPATCDLFEDAPAPETKHTSFEQIGNLFIEQLKTVFAGVSPKAKILENSRGNSMYMLCFAAGNPIGAGPALSIVSYLMDN